MGGAALFLCIADLHGLCSCFAFLLLSAHPLLTCLNGVNILAVQQVQELFASANPVAAAKLTELAAELVLLVSCGESSGSKHAAAVLASYLIEASHPHGIITK